MTTRKHAARDGRCVGCNGDELAATDERLLMIAHVQLFDRFIVVRRLRGCLSLEDLIAVLAQRSQFEERVGQLLAGDWLVGGRTNIRGEWLRKWRGIWIAAQRERRNGVDAAGSLEVDGGRRVRGVGVRRALLGDGLARHRFLVRVSFFFGGRVGAGASVRVGAAKEIGWKRFSGCYVHTAAGPASDFNGRHHYRLT